MKRSGFIFGILIMLLLTISFVSADYGEAQTCLRNQIQEKTCAKLTAEEKAFSLLADSKCKKELIDESREDECWPKTICKTKTTAQAILALSDKGVDTKKATDWLLAQAIPPSELEWYLQIDSSKPTTCQITYESQTYSIDIGENSKIKSDAGRCLTRSTDDTWLKVKPTCFGFKLEISCDESFSTSLFYKKKTSPIIYVSGNTKSASAQGSTEEIVNSKCFKSDETLCDYEATLWSALALKQTGKPVNAYLPYLNSMADENEKYLPESFLYKLIESQGYYEDLTDKQVSGYWESSGSKFYDTAVALYSMQSEQTTEKTNAITWLLGVQDKDGCWNGIRDTAFLLYAGWGKSSIPEPEEEQTSESCDDLKGKICDDNEICDGDEKYSSDGYCCLGKCKQDSGGGGGDEPEPKPDDEETNYLPILLTLGILIVLVIIGIVFKDKLRPYWFRLKSKFSKGGTSQSRSSSTPPGFFPPSVSQQFPRPTRRIIPNQQSRLQPRMQRKPKSGSEKEFSDVLKKLKDMGS